MPESAPYQYAKTLAFRAIDPQTDAATLIRFGRGLYVESLGDARGFIRDYGPRGARFPAWIASCAATDPAFAAFLTEDEAPIGLAVLGRGHDAKTGHVHHFYVRRAHRGQGFGGLLDDYARVTLARAGFKRARLNVTATNARAIRFYKAQGWTALPRRRLGAGLLHMEVAL